MLLKGLELLYVYRGGGGSYKVIEIEGDGGYPSIHL